jgi:carbohydrate esterase-like sialic acid-specific acetylesterase
MVSRILARLGSPVFCALLVVVVSASGAVADEEPIHVFLFGGQSNMRGGATDPPSEIRKQEDVLYACNVSSVLGYTRYRNYGWFPLQPLPSGGSIQQTYGPEVTAGVTLSSYYGSTTETPRMAAIKVARDGSRLGMGQDSWNVAKIGQGEMLDIFYDMTDTALQNLVQEEEREYKIEAMFWMQGESDANPAEGQTPQGYKANLQNMIAHIRTHLNAPEMAFYIGELDDWDSSGDTIPYRAVQLEICQEDPNAYFVETVGLSRRPSNVHFDQDGLHGLGDRFADAYVNTVGYRVPGDANGDGIVSDADYTLWADHYAQTGATWEDGDFSLNGVVTEADYTIWADNYGQGTSGAFVPEPTAMLLLFAGLCARPRRRLR